jgi:hypothetical protein
MLEPLLHGELTLPVGDVLEPFGRRGRRHRPMENYAEAMTQMDLPADVAWLMT